MGLIARSSESNTSYTQVPVGIYKAVCIKVIDLGTQRQEYNGDVSWKRQVLIIWELPEETNEGVPMTISKFYTLSLHEKSNLGIDLTAWRGRAFTEEEKAGFDIGNLIGIGCTLNITEGKNGKSRVNNIMPLSKADVLPPIYNDKVLFLIDDYTNNKTEVFNQLSEGIRNIILRSKELENKDIDMGDGGNGTSFDSDDIPF